MVGRGRTEVFSAEDVSCLVLPDGCVGLPTLDQRPVGRLTRRSRRAGGNWGWIELSDALLHRNCRRSLQLNRGR